MSLRNFKVGGLYTTIGETEDNPVSIQASVSIYIDTLPSHAFTNKFNEVYEQKETGSGDKLTVTVLVSSTHLIFCNGIRLVVFNKFNSRIAPITSDQCPLPTSLCNHGAIRSELEVQLQCAFNCVRVSSNFSSLMRAD